MQMNLIHRNYVKSVGTWDFDISFLDIEEAEHYEVLVLCGDAWVPCNDPSTSPPTVFKSSTGYRGVVDTAPAIFGVFATSKNSGRQRDD